MATDETEDDGEEEEQEDESEDPDYNPLDELADDAPSRPQFTSDM